MRRGFKYTTHFHGRVILFPKIHSRPGLVGRETPRSFRCEEFSGTIRIKSGQGPFRPMQWTAVHAPTFLGTSGATRDGQPFPANNEIQLPSINCVRVPSAPFYGGCCVRTRAARSVCPAFKIQRSVAYLHEKTAKRLVCCQFAKPLLPPFQFHARSRSNPITAFCFLQTPASSQRQATVIDKGNRE